MPIKNLTTAVGLLPFSVNKATYRHDATDTRALAVAKVSAVKLSGPRTHSLPVS